MKLDSRPLPDHFHRSSLTDPRTKVGTQSAPSVLTNRRPRHPLIRSLLLFAVAAAAEIGGGWLIWRWLRNGAPPWWGVLGAAALVGYGVIATYQPAAFGRTYAAYGGIFIVASLL